MTDRVTANHLQRRAFVYVRQSSQFQVLRNQESQRLQYAMRQRVESLGWRDIEIIDDDLGLSATSTSGRQGFLKMVAAVCMGEVGAIAAREVSRFARNNRDWHQLIEMCRMVDTLLIDHETIYDPRLPNDRFMLGMKGSFSEYELDLLRQRSLDARYAKADRGELVILAPVGYIKTPDQRLDKDPDQRIQQAIRKVFEKFIEFGSARQVLLWFLEHGLDFPANRHGVAGWETWWRRPNYGTVMRILTDPTYAGAYSFGRTAAKSELRDGVLHKRRVRKPIDEWRVLIPNHHEGYIGWEDFERIQRMLSDNATTSGILTTGAAKKGPALLSGLLRCRRCGRKLMVTYTGKNHSVPRYICRRGQMDNGEPKCIDFGALPVDEKVSREVLRVVQPGAIEAAVLAATEATARQDGVVESLQMDLKAAHYDAERARRQYDAVDPENRLVADELERRWQRSLERVSKLEQRILREQQHLTNQTPVSAESLEALARELQLVWDDPQTDVRLKKRVVRTLIEEIVVDIDGGAHEVEVVLHWKGGKHSTVRVPRRRRGQKSTNTAADAVDAVRILVRVCDDTHIAGYLNRNGLRTGRGNRWTKESVASLRSYRKIPRHTVERQEADGWMNLTQAAKSVGVSPRTLRQAAELGHVEVEHPLPDGPWVFERATLDAPDLLARFVHLPNARRGAAVPSTKQLSLTISTT